jgi:hypothetical protein
MNGIPYVWNADRLSTEELERLIERMDICTQVQFTEPIEFCLEKVEMCLRHGLPVSLTTKKALHPDIIELMSGVPRSSLHVLIEFPDPFIRSRLSPESSDPSDLLRMMHLVKSKKIFQALEVCWYPHLTHKLDVLESVEIFKNYVGHVIVQFPVISDLLYNEQKTGWEALSPRSLEDFKHYYEPSVQDRTWRVKGKYQQEFFSGLSDFIKTKKLTVEIVEWGDNESRIRHMSTGSDHPLGMRPVMYKKQDGRFHISDVELEAPCNQCGKTIFI